MSYEEGRAMARELEAGTSGMAIGVPLLLLRLEGAGVFLAALVLYAALDASWWLFALLILAPDLGMLFYLAGRRAGASGYNATHTYLAPLALGAAAFHVAAPLGEAVAVIWAAHIGFDRALGYGLKYPESFGRTHLGFSARVRRLIRIQHAEPGMDRAAD